MHTGIVDETYERKRPVGRCRLRREANMKLHL
jgi:hypothetical protein